MQEDQGLELPYRAWLLGLKTAGDSAQETSGPAPKRARTDEAIQRYRQVNQWLRAYFIADPVKDRRWTARLDRIVVHPLWGSVVLFGLLFILFQALFYGSEAPMNFIDDQLALLSSWVTEHVPLGFLAHLISKGLIPGIAGVLMFIPQIALLFAFISLLEESGYMARVVFIMDRFMRPFGLSGKSVVPMVSGTACAIPAIMSTRNMENSRERFGDRRNAVNYLLSPTPGLCLVNWVGHSKSILFWDECARRGSLGIVCARLYSGLGRFCAFKPHDAGQKNTSVLTRNASVPRSPVAQCDHSCMESNQKFCE